MCQNVQIRLHIVCMTLTVTLLIHNLWLVEGSCTFKGEEVCEGKIVKETKKSARICIDGKVLKKKKEEIKPWPGYGGSCMWYGEVLCDGAEVQVGFSDCIPFIYLFISIQDLYRWWFLVKCSKSKMSVKSRSWIDVTSDKRYKANKV